MGRVLKTVRSLSRSVIDHMASNLGIAGSSPQRVENPPAIQGELSRSASRIPASGIEDKNCWDLTTQTPDTGKPDVGPVMEDPRRVVNIFDRSIVGDVPGQHCFVAGARVERMLPSCQRIGDQRRTLRRSCSTLGWGSISDQTTRLEEQTGWAYRWTTRANRMLGQERISCNNDSGIWLSTFTTPTA